MTSGREAKTIFISYAHVDDYVPSGAESGWVTTLKRNLEHQLAVKAGRSDHFHLWLDHHLEHGTPFSRQLIETIRDSAALLIILSPGYLASDWCGRERDVFLEAMRTRTARPIFVIERDRVEESRIPDEICEFKRIRFWKEVGESGASRPLGVPQPHPSEPEYFDCLLALAERLAKEVTARHAEHETAPAVRAEKQRNATPTVFLADVTDDLIDERREVWTFLEQAHIPVVPEELHFGDPETFIGRVKEPLAEAALFVQLLKSPGKKPAGLPQGYVRCQFELARAAGKPILQWRDPDLDLSTVKDAEHKRLLQGEDVVAESLEDFKQEILKKVASFSQPEPDKSINVCIFVDACSPEDRQTAALIGDILRRYNISHFLPPETDDQDEYERDLLSNLESCTGLVIIYGDQKNSLVVRRRLGRLVKPLQFLPSKPAVAVFEGPPPKKAPLGFFMPNLTTLNCQNGVDEAEIRRFVDRLGAESHG